MVSSICDTNKDRCPIKILEKFSKKRGKLCPVNGCTVTNSTAFTIIEQKMVDTMLSCDILFISDQPQVSSVIIMSDDFDIHPAIALASVKTSKDILLVHNKPSQATIIAQSLSGMGIRLREWRI